MFPSSNNNSNRNPTEPPKLPKCDEFFAGIPFSCLLFYCLLFGVWLIDLFTDCKAYLINDYHKTILELQLWRLITSMLAGPSLLMICIVIFNLQTFLPSLEIKKGSTFLIVDLISRNIKVQLVLNLLQFIFSSFEIDILAFEGGALGLWFNYMTTFCWLNPKQMKLCCFNIKFNRRYYPFVFGLIISLLNWEIKADLIVGITLGLLQATLLGNMRDLLQANQYELIDNILCKIGLSSFKNWVRLNPSRFVQKICTSTVYSNLEFEQNQLLNSNDQSDDRTTKYTSNSDKNINHFSSLKGVRLGDY